MVADLKLDPPSKASKLYKNLLNDGYTTENIGSEEDFAKNLSDPAKAEKFYTHLISEGYNESNIGKKEDFLKTFQPEKPVVEKPIIDQALEADRLSKMGESTSAGNIDMFTPDETAVGNSKKIKDDLQAKGIPTDKIIENFTNLQYTPGKKAKYEKLAKTNPQQLNRMLSHDAYKMPILSSFSQQLSDAQGSGDQHRVEELKGAMSAIDNVVQPGNYSDVRGRVAKAAEGVRVLSGNSEDAVHKFGDEAALVYGKNMLPSFRDGKWYKPDSDYNLNDKTVYQAGLNTYHKAALDYLQDIDPVKYRAYKAILTPEKSRNPKDFDQRLGYQEYEKRVEEIGIKLKYDAAMEAFNEAKVNGDIDGMNMYIKTINETLADSKSIDDRYPLIKIMDAEQKAIDINGRSDNPIQRFGKVMGTSTDNALKSVWDFLSEPFRSATNYQNHLMGVLGGSKLNELETYLPVKDRTTIDSKIDLTPGAENDINRIRYSGISEEEQNSQIADYIIKNPDKVKRRQIDPETNLSLKSILYGVTDLGASIAPYVAATLATGGGASATALRSFTSEFSSAAMTMYHEQLANAIERGDENPYGAAFRRTAVMSFAMAGAGTAGKIRELALGSKNPAIKAMVASMDDKEIESAIKATWRGKTAQTLGAIKDKFIESAKSSAQITPAITVGNVVNKVIDNEPISAQREVKNMLVEGLKFFIFGSVMGAGSVLKNGPADAISKLSLYEAAKDPERFNTELDAQAQSGKITPDQHAEIKNNIDIANKVLQKTPLVDTKGKPLSDKAARDLLFLKFQETKANDLLSKDIPEPLQEKTTLFLEGIKEQIKQLQLPSKKVVEEDTKLSEPIEGVDNQGIPTGDNVPPPVDTASGEKYKSKDDLQKAFKDATGDDIEIAKVKMAGVELRNGMREAGNDNSPKEQMPYSNEQMKMIYLYDSFNKKSQNLFHSTPFENIESIQKEGLVTGKKAKFEGISSPSKISLSANEDVAKYYGKEGDAVIRVKKEKQFDDLEPDMLAGGEGAYTTGKNIPPEDLEIKVGKKWIPLKDYKSENKPKDATTLLKEARDTGKLGVFKTMEDEAAFKMISQQAQDLDSKGRPPTDKANADIAMKSTVKAFGQELVDAAMKKYPAEELTAEVHYEDKNGNQVITGKDGLKTVVNKKGEGVSAPTRRRVLDEHMADFDFSAGNKAPEPTDPIESQGDAMRHIAETSANPVELADIYDKNHETEKLNDVEAAIAEHGIGKVTGHSYNRFGDRNNMNFSKAKTYISKNGIEIDSLAKSISDHSGVEVSPEDIVAFMDRFPNGQDVLKERPNEIGKAAAAKFTEITGFPLNSKTSEIARMHEPTELTKEEVLAKDKINPDIAEQIIKDEGLTPETLEANKHLFDGFPYTKEDYELIKKSFDDGKDGQSTGEPEAAGPEGPGDADNIKTGVPGEETEQDTGTKPEEREDGEPTGQDTHQVTEEDKGQPDIFEQKVDDIADKVIDFLTPKTMKGDDLISANGLTVDQIVKGAAEAIKIAYRTGKEIKEAIEEAIDYVKKNWDPKWGVLPEDKLRDLFEQGMEQKLKEDADLKNLTKERVAEILKKNAANNTFIKAIKNSNLVTGVKKIFTGMVRAFHPFLLDGKVEGRDAAMIIRKNTGAEAHENTVADEASNKALSFWNKQKRVDNVAFMLSMENPDEFGGIHGDQRALALEYRNRMDKVFDMISKIKDVSFLDDYFPHFWKKPDKAKATLPNLGKNPLEGNKSFLKKRFYDNIMTGLNAGLELATYNPEEMVRLAEQNALHFKTANDIFTDLKQKGLLKYFQGKAEDGWVKIEDPMFNKKGAFITKDGEAKITEGAYYAKDAVASVINNFTGKGLFKRGGAIGATTKAVRYYNNLKNQIQLGLGLFHFTTTSIDATVTGWGNSLKLLTTGKPLLMAKGAFDLVKSATILPNLISTFAKGYRANKLYKEGAAAQEVNDLTQAGARVRMQKIYAIDAAYNMKKSWQNFTADHRPADLGKAVWNGLWGLPEKLVGHYLMDVWVPALKTGGYLRTLETELATNPNMTERETLKAKQRIWDSMDNRLGQVVYDNVFWDKTIKDLGFMSVRSLGWTGGTMKAFGTGVADVPKSLKNVMQGKGIEHTTAWLASLPLAVGMYGALYQYMMTGQGPQEFKDYFFPKDGTKDADGNDNRVSMPSYMKDIYAYSKDPLTTAQHKLSPFFNEMTDMMKNKDFYGVRIFNPDDPLYQKGIDMLKYQANTLVPFSFKQKPGEKKGFFESVATKEGAEKIMGIMPAAKEFERSDIQNAIAEEREKNFKKDAKTKEQFDLDGYRHEVKKALRLGVPWTDIPQELKDKAKYHGSSIKSLIRESKQDYYGVEFKHLDSDQQLTVWGKMSEDDKKLYGKFAHKTSKLNEYLKEHEETSIRHPEYQKYIEEISKIKTDPDDD